MSSRWIPRIASPGGGGQGPPGPPGPDHFAPKYLIGNIPAGDDPVGFNLNGFRYIPDPGDGSAIALALTQPNGPGDLWIRPGIYNLSNGGVVTPLIVPPNVRVQGSGLTTIILARSTGNQGAFALGTSSSLRDMTISAAASPASLGSDALVTVGDGASLRDLSLEISTSPTGQLRETVRFLSPPGVAFRPCDALNIRSSALTTTGAVSPTRCWFFEPGSFAFVRDITMTGGDIGADLDNGILVAQSLLIAGWTLFGIRSAGASGGGAVRIDEALVQSGGGTGTGIRLGAGGHVLRSVSVQGTGTELFGISLVEAGQTVSSVQIDDCQVFGFDTLVQLGDVTVLCAVQDVTVADSSLFVGRNGVVISNPASALCHLKGNTIQTNVPSGQAGQALICEGERHEIEGNHIEHNNADSNGTAVVVDSPRTAIVGNTLNFFDAVGLAVRARRCPVSGNEISATSLSALSCFLFDAPSGLGTFVGNVLNQDLAGNLGTPVRILSDLNTVSNNTIEKNPALPVVAGIELSGNNNVCIGNTVDGAPSAPVSDLGLGSEIAHNIGV